MGWLEKMDSIIVWPSDYHSDGTLRKRRLPFKGHGWNNKWRGTFSGDEAQRTRGLKEMAAAEKRKAAEKRREQRRNGGGGFLASLFGRKKPHRPSAHSSTRRPAGQPVRRHTTQRSGQGARAQPHRQQSSRPHAPERQQSRRQPPKRSQSDPNGGRSPPGRPLVRRETTTGQSRSPARRETPARPVRRATHR
ncbi:hypothetical protein CYLTODRAFT_416468 [Cylindrobasidium torrendii FP15055 ss-10]|uniref:Uncharacterized protein n=1 Tax=Cylindrobasidium torrendii FP15055 ss-10 TaxID=1314674 RepID=A0A0D7BUY6_9AGAR|nr:hypothetical protein CYLTODRAFT_416468 [Cylindrobasidium torrendii FP15055 ss-10]